MASNLFIIEAPGKRKSLAEVLFKAGVRDLEVEATVGHLATNPQGFKPLAVNGSYRETAYRVKGEKEALAARIADAAGRATRVFLATDDDQEGDVIARDVMAFCIRPEDQAKAVRLRLKALSVEEVRRSLQDVQPFEALMAAQGDARRVIDRLIGALSNRNGAVGRVQGSLLVLLGEQRPVVGVVTHTMAALDGGEPFEARVPVFAGQDAPALVHVEAPAATASTHATVMGNAPMNHDQILLAASLRTGEKVGTISKALQGLYESGRMSYPRSKDCAVSSEMVKRVEHTARINGAAFRRDLFGQVRDVTGEHGHESPGPVDVDVPVNRAFSAMPLDDKVLAIITQHLINCGVEGRLDRPSTAGLPDQLQQLNWSRLSAVGNRLWEVPPVEAGLQQWTKEQSLLHFMIKNELGRPSTIVNHIEKFLTRNLVNESFGLTSKGMAWRANVVELLGDRNLSAMLEDYVENHRKEPSSMVSEMVELFGLTAVSTMVGQQQDLQIDEAEIPGGDFS